MPASLADPIATYEVNVLGTVRLLVTPQAREFSGRLLYVSSGDFYGVVRGVELSVTKQPWCAPSASLPPTRWRQSRRLSWGQRQVMRAPSLSWPTSSAPQLVSGSLSTAVGRPNFVMAQLDPTIL